VATSLAAAAVSAMIAAGESAAEVRSPERPKTQRPKPPGPTRPSFVETDDGASLFYNDWAPAGPCFSRMPGASMPTSGSNPLNRPRRRRPNSAGLRAEGVR
jgi:hypothetical protein